MKMIKKYNTMKKWRKLLGKTLRFEKPFLANPEALLIGNAQDDVKLLDELYPAYLDNSDSDDEPSEYSEDSEGDMKDMGSISYF